MVFVIVSFLNSGYRSYGQQNYQCTADLECKDSSSTWVIAVKISENADNVNDATAQCNKDCFNSSCNTPFGDSGTVASCNCSCG